MCVTSAAVGATAGQTAEAMLPDTGWQVPEYPHHHRNRQDGGINPQAHLADVLNRIADHPIRPWQWSKH
jgi:hypothetical protein